jgi:hypothetical protein
MLLHVFLATCERGHATKVVVWCKWLLREERMKAEMTGEKIQFDILTQQAHERLYVVQISLAWRQLEIEHHEATSQPQ